MTDKTLTEPDIQFKISGKEMLIKPVKKSGHSGCVYLNKSWIGKRVYIVRIDEIEPIDWKKMETTPTQRKEIEQEIETRKGDIPEPSDEEIQQLKKEYDKGKK